MIFSVPIFSSHVFDLNDAIIYEIFVMIGCVAPVSVLLTCAHVYVFEDLFILYPYAAVWG